ncbi:MAG: hydrogenase maturation nickel metallochaperone HypA [Acidobacteria bacterium]|nr:hydrogenase maturation nickel metallochaperone HypA [Acidobacteriota bacterium]MBI3655203.1 hydrogenase maturation nickel metallochaperone HypA [Acidobacteriota bacterium]
MHEASLVLDLLRRIEGMAGESGARSVIGVKVRMGTLCHFSPEHLRGHFQQAARGTLADGARLTIEISSDVRDPHAQDIMLDSLEVEL